jgi:HAD superfamily hydrolase (TIGR01509 family)
MNHQKKKRKTMMSKRQAIIFDMDGLMVNTEPLARQAWRDVLQEYGQPLPDEVYQQMIGHRTDWSAQMLLARCPLPVTAVELAASKEARFDHMRAQGVPVMPGLLALHASLEERGLPWAVATSSPRRHAEIILEQLGLAASCGAIAAGDEVVHSKPAPDIYLLAAERLGVDPAVCLALEDSAPGGRAALAAGMKVVAVPTADTADADYSFTPYRYGSLTAVLADLDLLLAD